MSNRTLIFFAFAMLVMMTASFLQNLYFPAESNFRDAPPPVATTDPLADSDVAAGKTELNGPVQSDEPSLASDPPASVGLAENLLDAADADDSEPQSIERSNKTAVGEQPIDVDDADESKSEPASELVSLGSVAPDSRYRYLVTFDTIGGAVRRVELNYRGAKDRYRYRELDYEGGYLGELDCVTTAGPTGCQVRVVGNGTPADQAGMRPGDIIKSVNGEPITTADDWLQVLARFKPGKSISVTVGRGEPPEELPLEIKLTDKPMEMIRPDPDLLRTGTIGETSFRTTLRVPSPLKDEWPEIESGLMDAVWRLEKVSVDEVHFSRRVVLDTTDSEDPSVEDAPAASQEFLFTKIYTLHSLDEAEQIGEASRDFHFSLRLEIENLSNRKGEITCQLDGPLGTPTETWWYQNKIHGRSWAIGYIAGARDVIGSTAQEEFTFFGGPEIVANIEKAQPEYQWLLKPPSENTDDRQAVNYLSVDTQYFNVALMPVTDESPFTAYSVLADMADVPIPKSKKEQKLVDCTFRMFKNIEIPAGEKWTQTFNIFAGPKEPEILAAYGLQEVRSFGWFAMFSKPLCWLLKVFYYMTFQLGYGIPIILLTVVVRSLMIPISRKAALNAQMMQYLQPQMKELADKYKDDMEKRGQAQRDLFKKYKYNPFGGCFMMFLQIPIFIGLYRGLSVDIALRDQPLIKGLGWCTNLAAPDQLWYWKDSLPQFLGFLTDETGWLGPYLNVLPIITCVLFIVQQKLFTPPPTDEQQEMMQKVMKYMMVFMGVLFFKVPSGLCLYFITSSLWGIIERKMLPKPELDKNKLEGASGVTDVATDKASLRKLEKQQQQKARDIQQRLDDQEEKKRRDKERRRKMKNRGI